VIHAPSRLRALVLAGTLLAAAPSLAGCVVAAAGAGAAGGYAVLGQELSPEQQVKDAATRSVVVQSWGEYNQEVAHDLTATVYDGRVLITGRVPKEDWRQEAVKRAWKADGVKEVYNEIEVGPDTHFIDEARDTVISTRLRNDLLFDQYVKSINYTIRTGEPAAQTAAGGAAPPPAPAPAAGDTPAGAPTPRAAIEVQPLK